MVLENILIYFALFFICSLPVFPVQFTEETAFSSLYILAFFVEDYGVWVYFWALHSVPLIVMSVFVTILCCFDYCNFVVSSELWEVQLCSFTLALLWQVSVFFGNY